MYRNPETVGARLRRAIELYGPKEGRRRGKALFLDRLGKVKGANPPSLDAYLADRTTPPLEFLWAAGELLGVTPEWLAFGTPPHPEAIERPELVAALEDLRRSLDATLAVLRNR